LCEDCDTVTATSGLRTPAIMRLNTRVFQSVPDGTDLPDLLCI
jgi:hypothetical protein